MSDSILKAVKEEGYTTATPIQAQAIPHVLAGRDVLGCAQTGTGKTAAFAMPLLHRLSSKPVPAGAGRRPRCLVLCPTRELAAQIADSLATYGRGLSLRHTTIYGGVGQGRQVDALRRGVDFIVATPGRLMDLMEQRHVNLSAIETLVLDESDRMLDMGFIQPIRRIVAQLPAGRQTLLFSATMAPEIRRLADSLLREPAVVNVAPVAAVAAQIEESVYRVEKNDKPALLAHLVRNLPMHRTIVFTRTKHGADRVVRRLQDFGIRSEAIHGNKSQNARQRALAQFTANRIPVLVATDIASRGIDVEGVTHVVNYDLTHEPETYVHRIGRTGRAGASGAAVSFCDREEVSNLRAIERLTRRQIPSAANPLAATTSKERSPSREPETRHVASTRPAPSRPVHPLHKQPQRNEERRQPAPAAKAGQRTSHFGAAHQGGRGRPHHGGKSRPQGRARRHG